jgi:membrane protease YdiL (CAAX protease family)
MRQPVEPVRSVRPFPFFVLTYVLSWVIWIPLALSHFAIGPLRIAEGASAAVRLLGVLMPAAAALVLTARIDGRDALGRLLQCLTLWRVGWVWWCAAVVVPTVLLLTAGLAYNLLGGSPRVAVTTAPVAAIAVNVVFLLIATLGEEIGWRGVALPALQERHSPLVASGILGVAWATWHLPFWLLLDTFDRYGPAYLALNFLLVVPMTFYITWFFNQGSGSLLLPVAFHISFNIVNVALLPVTENIGAFAVLIGLEWIIILPILPKLRASAAAESQPQPHPATGPDPAPANASPAITHPSAGEAMRG